MLVGRQRLPAVRSPRASACSCVTVRKQPPTPAFSDRAASQRFQGLIPECRRYISTSRKLGGGIESALRSNAISSRIVASLHE